MTALYPRLDLLRCIILSLSSKRDEAAALLDAVSEKTEGFTRDRNDGDSDALTVDSVFAQSALVGGADGLLPGELEARLPPAGLTAAGDERRRILSGARHNLLCVACYEHASFEECRRHGLEALAHFAEDTQFGGEAVVSTCLGMAAMAQGRPQEAWRWYRQARQITRTAFSSDPCLTVGGDVLTIELDLERNREKAIQQRTLKNLTEVQGLWVDIHSTALAVSAELTFAQYDGKAVIQLLTKAVDDVQVTGIQSLSNVAAALLAYYLVEVGRADQAGQVWRECGLPCGATELLDIECQSWRTMEVLSCSRVRLLAEQGEYGAAEELASSLCAVASERGLTRTLLRGLALSMVVAYREGRPERAMEHLIDFLRAVRGVGYTRPLVRHRAVSWNVLRRLLATDLDEDLRMAAEAMLAQVGSSANAPSFSTRELEVLAAAARGLQNKEIARRLAITDQGVRYHLKNIYRKTGAGNKKDAVRYARSLGVLP